MATAISRWPDEPIAGRMIMYKDREWDTVEGPTSGDYFGDS